MYKSIKYKCMYMTDIHRVHTCGQEEGGGSLLLFCAHLSFPPNSRKIATFTPLPSSPLTFPIPSPSHNHLHQCCHFRHLSTEQHYNFLLLSPCISHCNHRHLHSKYFESISCLNFCQIFPCQNVFLVPKNNIFSAFCSPLCQSTNKPMVVDNSLTPPFSRMTFLSGSSRS